MKYKHICKTNTIQITWRWHKIVLLNLNCSSHCVYDFDCSVAVPLILAHLKCWLPSVASHFLPFFPVWISGKHFFMQHFLVSFGLHVALVQTQHLHVKLGSVLSLFPVTSKVELTAGSLIINITAIMGTETV